MPLDLTPRDIPRPPEWLRDSTKSQMLIVWLCCLFFISASGQTAGPLFWRVISFSKRLFLRKLHSFGVRTTLSQFYKSKPPIPPKLGPKRHFQAKMPKTFNGNICKTIYPIKFKCKAQPGTTRCEFNDTKLGQNKRGLCHVTYFSNFGTPNISGTAEDTNL